MRWREPCKCQAFLLSLWPASVQAPCSQEGRGFLFFILFYSWQFCSKIHCCLGGRGKCHLQWFAVCTLFWFRTHWWQQWIGQVALTLTRKWMRKVPEIPTAMWLSPVPGQTDTSWYHDQGELDWDIGNPLHLDFFIGIWFMFVLLLLLLFFSLEVMLIALSM